MPTASAPPPSSAHPPLPLRRTPPPRQDASLRIAAIDVGSNSIHMIVSEVDADGAVTPLWRMKEMVGLGRATFPSRTLSKETIDRAVAAMARFHAAAVQRKCEKIVAVATSAVREAINGGDFIERVRRLFNLDVKVISGREEARLIYLGVRHACPLRGGPHLVIDMGGGSVEFIVGDHRRALLLESRKLGAARMTAAYVNSDPISEADLKSLRQHYDRELTNVCEEILKLKPIKAIGTSGTLENLSLMCCGGSGNHADSNGNGVTRSGEPRPQIIARPELHVLLEKLLKSDSAKRAQIPGLDDGRKDQIVAGAVLVDELFRRLKLRRLQICKSALREGILLDYLERHRPALAIRQQVPQPRPRSVIALARRCAWHKSHSEQVARLCLRLFDQLQSLHGLEHPQRELIEYAALLHDIGWHIGRTSHHKHSMYLIEHGDLKSFTPEEISIIANIARYHRKSLPKPKHAAYGSLSPAAKKVVNVGAALLRIADGLDRSHSNIVRDLRCRNGEKEVKCTIYTRWDAQLEIWGATRKSKMFQKIFRKPITFEIARG